MWLRLSRTGGGRTWLVRVLSLGLDHWGKLWRIGLRPRSPAALGFAIVCVAGAAAVRVGLGLISPDSAVFASFYSATLVAALVGGAAAGGLAAGLGAIVAYALFVPPEWSLPGFELSQVVSSILYVASSVVIIWAAESYRTLLARLRDEENARQLLNRELTHRIKNTLASVQAIVNQSLSDLPDVRKKINDRIAALGTTNDMLINSDCQGASLRQILSAELAPYGGSRFRLAGRDVVCPSSLASLLNLVFHELATNAAKHGALSGPEGRIAVSWTAVEGRLHLDWIESGGPRLTPPTRRGFGTKLLRCAAQQFNGSVDMQFEPTGLRCNLSLALPDDAELKPPGILLVPLQPGIDRRSDRLSC